MFWERETEARHEEARPEQSLMWKSRPEGRKNTELEEAGQAGALWYILGTLSPDPGCSPKGAGKVHKSGTQEGHVVSGDCDGGAA